MISLLLLSYFWFDVSSAGFSVPVSVLSRVASRTHRRRADLISMSHFCFKGDRVVVFCCFPFQSALFRSLEFPGARGTQRATQMKSHDRLRFCG